MADPQAPADPGEHTRAQDGPRVGLAGRLRAALGLAPRAGGPAPADRSASADGPARVDRSASADGPVRADGSAPAGGPAPLPRPPWLPDPAALRELLRSVRDLVGQRLVSATVAVRRAWRQSLQLRMMTITLLVSGLLVGAFGYLVVELTTRNLLDRAHSEVEGEMDSGAEYARGQLSVHAQPADEGVPDTMSSIVADRSDGRRLRVALVPPSGDDLEEVASWGSGQAVAGIVSERLVASVAEGNKAWQIVTGTLEPGGEAVTYLAYGAPVPSPWGGPEPFQLYYLAPLTGEISQATDIRNTVLATGVALVLLLAVVTGLVTRLVVHPVRLAARTAQRLSAGLLDQRMAVQGEDDLAMLGASFNQMADSLQRQIVRLEEMSRLQRRFTSDVSHELRTPLTTVRMAADLIFNERTSYPPEVARSAELLQNELDRFEALLTDLLEISRFDAGFAALDSELTDLVPVVRQAVDRLSAIGARAGTVLRMELPPTAVIAEVDPRRVDRIVRNLVENAIEHGEGRPVEVVLAANQTAVAVTVRDHGVGIRPEDHKLVFNRFWRADTSRARQSGGTGLGLSISVEDARLHGGWLEAWGALGQGAQFRLTLPLRAGERPSASPLPLVPTDAEPDRAAPPADPATAPAGSAVVRQRAGLGTG